MNGAKNQLAFDWLYVFNKFPEGKGFTDLCAALDLTAEEDLTYYVAQHERGEGGHEHIHVFCQFGKRVKPGHLGAILPKRWRECNPHFERRRGTPEEADAYHRKEETRIAGPHSRGTLKADRAGQGKRNDVKEATAIIRAGGSLRRVAEEHPEAFVRYHRGFSALRAVLQPEPERLAARPNVFILWGDSCVGKTTWCYNTFGASLYKVRLPERGDMLRFDGYDPEKHDTLLFDEFGSKVDIKTINELCDVWPFRARLYGGEQLIRPKTIIFTDNDDPQTWWGGKYAATQTGAAFFDVRVTECIHLRNLNDNQKEADLRDITEWNEKYEMIYK